MQKTVPFEIYEEEQKRRIAAEAEIAELKSLVSQLMAKVRELEARLHKNSRNSNKPPSSDDYAKPVVKNLRQKSTRKNGGQEGHEGITLRIDESPDEIINLYPDEQCDNCGGEVEIDRENYTVRQIKDIAPPVKRTAELHIYKGTCMDCGKTFTAPYAQNAGNPVVYGENVKAMLSYLTQYQLLPLNRTAELVSDLFGLDVSEGTIIKANAMVYEQLAPFEDKARDTLTQAEVANFDETGMRVDGRLHWLHSASTSELTLYGMNKKRDRVAMDAMGVLPKFTGIAVHDHWKPYYHYTECSHAECNGHHLRKLMYLYEDLKYIWAHDMIELLLRMKAHVDLSKLWGASCLNMTDIQAYQADYKMILESARSEEALRPKIVNSKGKVKKSESERMINHLTDYEVETLTFAYDFNVPFDNNLAERDMRMPKGKQKISGCFRTFDGAKAFARARSFISTCRKRDKNIFDGLRAVFDGKALGYLEMT